MKKVVFISSIPNNDIRERLLQVGEADPQEYTTIPLQGSGTYALEAVMSTAIPSGGKLLVVINGAYGYRIAKIASVLKVDTKVMEYPENKPPVPAEIEAKLNDLGNVNMVAITHCETTTGIINPIREVGAVVKKSGAKDL